MIFLSDKHYCEKCIPKAERYDCSAETNPICYCYHNSNENGDKLEFEKKCKCCNICKYTTTHTCHLGENLDAAVKIEHCSTCQHPLTLVYKHKIFLTMSEIHKY